jgi:hypothetical protein
LVTRDPPFRLPAKNTMATWLQSRKKEIVTAEACAVRYHRNFFVTG